MGGPTSLASDTIWGGLAKPSVLMYIKKKKNTPSSRRFSSFCGKVAVNYSLCWD